MMHVPRGDVRGSGSTPKLLLEVVLVAAPAPNHIIQTLLGSSFRCERKMQYLCSISLHMWKKVKCLHTGILATSYHIHECWIWKRATNTLKHVISAQESKVIVKVEDALRALNPFVTYKAHWYDW